MGKTRTRRPKFPLAAYWLAALRTPPLCCGGGGGAAVKSHGTTTYPPPLSSSTRAPWRCIWRWSLRRLSGSPSSVWSLPSPVHRYCHVSISIISQYMEGGGGREKGRERVMCVYVCEGGGWVVGIGKEVRKVRGSEVGSAREVRGERRQTRVWPRRRGYVQHITSRHAVE